MPEPTVVEFLRPRLCGARFEGASIPLEMLKDLAVLEEMVIEVAKWQFKKEHPGKKRSPRGFTDGIEFRLTGIEKGSAIPVISLVVTSLFLPGIPPTNQIYFENARDAIVDAVDAAEHGRIADDHLPREILGYFDKIGRSLREDEAIEFTTSKHTTPVRLTKETRHRLCADSHVRQLTEEVIYRGVIPEADQDNMTFELQLVDGQKVSGPIPEQHLSTIIEAFNGYREGIRVLIQGIGKFDRQGGRLSGFESIEHLNLLDPLDVYERLDELRSLENGWLGDGGIALSAEGLEWFSARFENHYPNDLQSPYIYPTAEGGILAEWSLAGNDISLEVNLHTHVADWHRLHLATNEEDTREVCLDNDQDWEWLAGEIRNLSGGEA